MDLLKKRIGSTEFIMVKHNFVKDLYWKEWKKEYQLQQFSSHDKKVLLYTLESAINGSKFPKD